MMLMRIADDVNPRNDGRSQRQGFRRLPVTGVTKDFRVLLTWRLIDKLPRGINIQVG